MASKQFTMEYFFRDNPVLSTPILYEFEPCDNDKINKLSIEHNAALCLSKEARRWVSCVAKEVRVIRDSQEELKKLLAQIGDKPPYALQSDQIGPQAELEARIDELRQIIRRAQTSKKKAEARLEAMKEAGVNVEEWVRTSDTESVSASDSPAENFSRSGTVTSRSSRQSETFEGSIEASDAAFYDSDSAQEQQNVSIDAGQESPYVPDLTSAVDVVAAVQEAWDAAAETEEIEEPEPVETKPVESQETLVNGEVPTAVAAGQRCVAVFSYEAANSDELSFVEQEELELIGEGDGDGWVMARNYRGEEGYIPQNYVEIIEPVSNEPSSRPPLTSFSSVDYTMPNEEQEPSAEISPAAADIAETKEIAEVPSSQIQRPADLPSSERISVCQALYDYEATCDEELSFFEGQVIKILRKKVCDVDDGWWEGELDGKIGLFPSLVVEELKENGEPLTPMSPESPPEAPPPPPYSPPEAQFIITPAQVILTQPTPEIENPDESGPKAPDDTGKYAPLVSSPESPTKTMAAGIKDSALENIAEEICCEPAIPTKASEECPTVVVTSITGGDTPTSDDDLEIKEKEEPAAKESSDNGTTYQSSEVFECTFPKDEDDVTCKEVPSSSSNVSSTTEAKKVNIPEVEPEPVKMEVNGADMKSFNGTIHSETTG